MRFWKIIAFSLLAATATCGGGSAAIISDECSAWEQKLLSCCKLWADESKEECLFAGSASCETRACSDKIETRDCTPCR